MEKDNNIGSSSKNNSGILRVDTSKSRIVVQSPAEPSSPQPSVDRLSVSFAPDNERSWSESDYPHLHHQINSDVASDVSVRVNVFNMAEGVGIGGGAGAGSSGSPAGQGPHFPGNRLSANLTDEDDDYSVSMTAILQRRASARKVKGLGKRRTSSPMDSDRRRSSVFTTSSGDTAITMEGEGGAVSQEQIFENIRLHKEVLESVKQQPWEMRRKLKLVQQAKEYVKRHEGQLQERLAQSKSTKDIMARFNILLIRYWQHLKREASNLGSNMIPWELRIKEIESHFGSVVASYFTFLRWVFWINIVISSILICFVVIPEVFAADPATAGQRKILLESEKKTSKNLETLWDFEGELMHSPMFYGYYTDKNSKEGFPLPLSYFITGMGVYIYSFVVILRRMASNSRQSKLSEKEDECAFSWRLFTAWDYMIGNPETAFNRFASITMGFKESLLEEKEKTKDERNWKVIMARVLANIIFILQLISSAWVVVIVVERSGEPIPEDAWWGRESEITLAMNVIAILFPTLFELLGIFLEKYHPRKQLRWQLARIMALNFLNLYTLIFALFGKVKTMTVRLQELKLNQTVTSPPFVEFPSCTDITVNCTLLDNYAAKETIKLVQTVMTIAANLTTEVSLPASTAPTGTSFATNFMSKINVTEFLTVLHNLISSKMDWAQIVNASASNPDFASEMITDIFESENYTFWTNQSTMDLNDTHLWTPENRTALTTALPIVIKLIMGYIATILPTLSKTTPLSDDYNMYSTQNVTIRPPLITSTVYGTKEYDNESTVYNDTSPSPSLSTTVRAKKGKKRRRNTKVPKVKTKRDAAEDEEFGRETSEGKTTEQPGEDYTEPDYFIPSEPEEKDEYPDNNTLAEIDFETNLVIGKNGGRGYDGKMSTRGDIPGDAGEEITTSTTTAMPSTTIAVTTESPPESLEKFLTRVMTIVTMIFTHNSTKTDEIDYSKIRDFSKWVTTLESMVETRKVTSSYNSTFGTTVKVNIEETGAKKCFVTFCGNGTTVPRDLARYLNCSDGDNICSLTALQVLGAIAPRSDNCWIPKSRHCITTAEPPTTMDPKISLELRELCWETMFGQELVKLTVMDLIFTVVFTLIVDFIRAIFVRVLNPCWCWNMEKYFPQYGDFKIAENILHLVNNQGMIWMGMFFSPGLPILNLFKLVILMYIRSWAVMTCNVPHETVFRASRSNNFYFALLLFMLFLCTLPVAYAIVWLEPSWHCGPFSHYQKIFHILTQAILNTLPEGMRDILDYIASPAIVIPMLVLLILIIYYLLSLTGALREANNDLKIQLRRERTEERRKMFKMAGGKKKTEETPFNKWKMIIPMAKAVSNPDVEKPPSVLTTGKQTGFAGAAKRAAIKSKKTDEDDGNATDVDQASLPEDNVAAAKKSQLPKTGGVRKPSCTDSVASTRSEIPLIKISKEDDGGKSTAQPGPSRIDRSRIDPLKRERVRKALIQASKDQDAASRSDISEAP